MSSAFSAGNGRFMSRSSSTVFPPTVTTKAPLRGFSLLTSTVTPGRALASRFARVLNAPQLLQASTSTTAPPLDDLEVALGLAAVGFLAGALALVFLAMAALAMDLHASQRAGDRLKAEPAASSCQKLGEHSLASGLVKPLASKSRGREAQTQVRTASRRTPRQTH